MIYVGKKKEHLEAVPKSKKKLSIIDPVTGKDILETVHPSESEQSSVSYCYFFIFI